MSILLRAWTIFHPPTPGKTPISPEPGSKTGPVRIGLLGAANIAPIALLLSARSCPDAEVTVVGARSLQKAQAFAKRHGVGRAVQGYEAVLSDPEVDAVYNPLPNGLHYEWTMKALQAGKHVLLEKPATNTPGEAERIFAFAKEKGLVVLEAFHYQFHPAAQRLHAIVSSGELGRVQKITAHLTAPSGFIKPDDIRFQYALGGGAAMDMGCYVTSISRYLAGREPVEVIKAEPVLQDPGREPLVDRRMEFTYLFPALEGEERGPTAECVCDLSLPGWGPGGLLPRWPEMSVRVLCEAGEAGLNNFVMPVFFHSISVRSAKGRRTERAFTFGKGEGEQWWTTYRYQLQAFVDKVKGREPQHWITGEDTVGNMRAVQMVYEKSGLGARPESDFEL
ncbi:NAD(P)-binding protein [Calocera viscosa TUFC12733]|uniref:D-xylose 1-dehydrogenase (NADP(+), D-xylono-1,5-lactone-forming) n=1 Tax=Calocera viscosa (strain TUFC12733) TaxID=1330018 RepID=A0A167L7N5_CALVF|nr:NAD(P)-binding protein [Calocera viscosa TUFC12733]